jgi:predicted glutamine amidotransferase
MRTYNMMAHIRYATQGAVSLENVHPFTRVWKGIQVCFAHNGDCPKFKQQDEGLPILLGQSTLDNVIFYPVGDTDSEAVFCAILNALHAEFPGNQLPTLPVLHEFLSTLCQEIIHGDGQDETIFNFLLGCGQYTMFAFSWPGSRPGSSVWNGLFYLIRQPPFSIAKLIDEDYSIDFEKETTLGDRVAVIATKPLTGEDGWIEMSKGELIMFDKGKPYRTPKCCEIVEQEGRGLMSRWSATKCTSWKGSPSLLNSGGTLTSSVHVETLLESPSLSKLTLSSCSSDTTIPESSRLTGSRESMSPTTVALPVKAGSEDDHLDLDLDEDCIQLDVE